MSAIRAHARNISNGRQAFLIASDKSFSTRLLTLEASEDSPGIEVWPLLIGQFLLAGQQTNLQKECRWPFSLGVAFPEPLWRGSGEGLSRTGTEGSAKAGRFSSRTESQSNKYSVKFGRSELSYEQAENHARLMKERDLQGSVPQHHYSESITIEY